MKQIKYKTIYNGVRHDTVLTIPTNIVKDLESLSPRDCNRIIHQIKNSILQ